MPSGSDRLDRAALAGLKFPPRFPTCNLADHGVRPATLDELRVSIDDDARRTSEQISKKVSDLSSAQRW